MLDIIVLWPCESMSRFGQNPFGENLYRIVLASSRRHLVHGTWDDGSVRSEWTLTYPVQAAAEGWVLERWISAYEFTQCTPETWNMTMLVLGPYPSRGEYQIAHAFVHPPADIGLDKLIMWIEAGGKFSSQDNLDAINKNLELEQKDVKNEKLSRIANILPAFGNAPMSGPGGGRGTKTMPELKTAEELGLPTRGGHMTARPTKQKFEVEVSV